MKREVSTPVNTYVSTNATTGSTPTSTIPAYATKKYNVGDYYNVGGKEGIVFEISADGTHGKIAYPIGEAEWSLTTSPAWIKDASDGENNMKKIKEQSNWESNYPAFAMCASLGEDWYLPAANEAMALCKISDSFQTNNLGVLDGYIWTSTESGNGSAAKVVYSSNLSLYNRTKKACVSVIAVSKF